MHCSLNAVHVDVGKLPKYQQHYPKLQHLGQDPHHVHNRVGKTLNNWCKNETENLFAEVNSFYSIK